MARIVAQSDSSSAAAWAVTSSRNSSNKVAAFRGAASAAMPPVVAAPLAELGDFGANPGKLRAWYHVPRSVRVKPPLVVVLHGCTQTAAGYDHGSGWSQLAEEQGFVLRFPEQRRANNMNLCFNWFEPSRRRWTRRRSSPGRATRAARSRAWSRAPPADRAALTSLAGCPTMPAMARKPRRQNVQFGGFQAVKTGTPSPFGDLYYWVMEMTWPAFVALSTGVDELSTKGEPTRCGLAKHAIFKGSPTCSPQTTR
eukprot:gene33353-44648_t